MNYWPSLTKLIQVDINEARVGLTMPVTSNIQRVAQQSLVPGSVECPSCSKCHSTRFHVRPSVQFPDQVAHDLTWTRFWLIGSLFGLSILLLGAICFERTARRFSEQALEWMAITFVLLNMSVLVATDNHYHAKLRAYDPVNFAVLSHLARTLSSSSQSMGS